MPESLFVFRLDNSLAHMYHILFIHLSISRHLGCFHILAIVNIGGINSGPLASHIHTHPHTPTHTLTLFLDNLRHVQRV